jgi:integrase/recombinase XerD
MATQRNRTKSGDLGYTGPETALFESSAGSPHVGSARRVRAIQLLKTFAGHRSISTTAAYLYSSPSQLKAAVELV